ncbi:hypothetical protein DFQ26_008373 [Actinomortierella ambigua]|nr:hypothetical protein DFQ26_008373 [Actinomortierella ambigua]
MFTPRKNRNIRKKVVVDDDDETQRTVTEPTTSLSVSAQEDETAISPAASPAIKAKKPKKKMPASTLSFGGDDEEGEEVIAVKKSAASRRMAQAIQSRKEGGGGGDPTALAHLQQDIQSIGSRASVSTSASYSKEALEELKRSTMSRSATKIITSEDDSMAGSSGVEEDEAKLLEQKFPSQYGGSSTVIPDAEAIYRAKKARERARLGLDHRDEEDFISLVGGSDDKVVEPKNTRLVREEDDENDDGETEFDRDESEKLTLGSKNQRMAARMKRENMKQLIEDMDEEEDEDEEETRQWEMLQIRQAGLSSSGRKDRKQMRAAAPVHRSIAIPELAPIPSLGEVKGRLASQLHQLRETHAMHSKQLDQVRHELAALKMNAVDDEEAMEKASARYTFFQELKSYGRNLAAFFDEKFPELEAIETEFRQLVVDRTQLVVQRRARDLLDDLAEFAVVVNDAEGGATAAMGAKDNGDDDQEPDEFGRSRKVDPAERRRQRQADRARRRKARLAKRPQDRDGASDATNAAEKAVVSNSSSSSRHTNEYEGLSTDDEVGAGDERDLMDAFGELDERLSNLLKDVGEDFRTMVAVKKHFQAWKTDYYADYTKAYGGLLLPMVFDFYIRHELCLWNPFRLHQDFSDQAWHQIVSSYSIVHPSSSSNGSRMDLDSGRPYMDDDDDEEDMDQTLINRVVAKSICPKVQQLLSMGGVDLYSTKQVKHIRAILEQLQDYVDAGKEPKMAQILKTVQDRVLETAQAHRAQFVQAAQPLTPRRILTSEGLVARDRYLWRTLGLFRNLMSLRRVVVPKDVLYTHVVDGLLHECLLRLLEDDDMHVETKYKMIYEALPADLRAQERHAFIERLARQT